MVICRLLRYGVIHLEVLATYIRKPLMHSNLLWGTLSSLVNVSSSRTRLLVFPHLIWVAVVATSLLKVCATVPAQWPGVRECYVRFLDAS